jgi:Zn-dependent M28 family amino/carboxypeptidase
MFAVLVVLSAVTGFVSLKAELSAPRHLELFSTPASTVINEIIQQVSEDRLREQICQLQSREGGEFCNTDGSRWSCDGTAIDRAVEYARQYFEKLGLKTELAPFSLRCRAGLSHNIEAVLPGADPQSQQSVLITAHLDSTTFSASAGSPAPGADDNASGSVAVFEAARILSQYKFKHTIRFVLFTGEEQGLVGSRAYAGKLAGDGVHIVGVYNMDMIGYDSDDDSAFEAHAGTREESLKLADLLVQTITTYEIKLVPDVLEAGATNRSDHASFWSRGYPAVLVIEDSEYGETDDFNPYYHSTSDTLDKLNLPYAKRIAQAVIGAAAQLAEPMQ